MILKRFLTFNFSYALKTPLNPELFKNEQGIQKIRKSLKARFRDQTIIENLQTQYEQYRKSLFEFEGLSKKLNDINKEMGQLYKKKQINQVEKLKNDALTSKKLMQDQQQLLKNFKNQVQTTILKLGNIVHTDVVISKDEQNNKILKKSVANIGKYNKENKSYQQLSEMFKICDLKRGQKVSGHRGYFLTGPGVKLALGLAQYGIFFLEKKGYSLYQTPAMILEDVLRESCQLQTIETDMYKLSDQNKVLIATSQQSLAGFYRGEVLQQKTLPIRMAGYSSCFRKEAGAHGKDIHGLFRVHQFQKVEQFAICKQNQSQQMMLKMLAVSQQFYQSLGIPYQVVDIVSGELNDAANRKYDLQGWYPSQNKFRELVSISNCTDYQSRLLDIKYRIGKETKYPHMLNGTLIAIQRSITCILENYYDSDKKTVIIPDVLRQFVGTNELTAI